MSEADFIIVVKNQLDYTRHAIESICRHVRHSFRCILIDNASTDGTAGYLKSLQKASASKDDSRFFIIQNDTNRGYSGGLNQGLKHSQAPYVFFCNNDIAFYPDAADEMIRIAEENSATGLVNPNSNEFGMAAYDEKKINRWKGTWIERCHTSGFCVLVKRQVIDRIGGIDPAFSPAYFEDMDYAERAKQAGFRCVMARGAYVHHFGTRTFLANEKKQLWVKNRCLFIQRWGSTKWFAFIAAGRQLADESLRAKLIQGLLKVVRSDIAVMYLFIPPGTRKYFEAIHDSFRIVETPAGCQVPFFLLRRWRSVKTKPISRLYVPNDIFRQRWEKWKLLHQTDILTVPN